MAYRIATLGLATLMATTVLAQPMPGDGGPTVTVVDTITVGQTTTIMVDQSGHTVAAQPAGAGTGKDVNVAAYGQPQGYQPQGYQYNANNDQHAQHHHHHNAPAPSYNQPASSYNQPASSYNQPIVPTTHEPVPVPATTHSTTTYPPAQPATTKPTTTQPTQPKNTGSGGGSGGGSTGSAGGGPGLAVQAGSEATAQTIASASGGKLKWWHNWQPNQPQGGKPDMNFCPMLHDTWGNDANTWEGLWKDAKNGGYKCYLGQNEPDHFGQDAGAIATSFAQYFGGISADVVACPSFTSDQGDDNKGLKWYAKFETACKNTQGCSYNTVQAHYYGYGASGAFSKSGNGAGWANFVQWVSDVKTAAAGKKIWITEYALGPCDKSGCVAGSTQFSDAERSQFIIDATQHLAGTVDAYAPYAVGPGGYAGSNDMTGTGGLASAYLGAC